jgi:hypothetical protein
VQIPAEPSPELRIPNAAAQTRAVSVAKIRLDRLKSTRSFKGIICDDISEFESHMPSDAGRSLWGVTGAHLRQGARHLGECQVDLPGHQILDGADVIVTGDFRSLGELRPEFGWPQPWSCGLSYPSTNNPAPGLWLSR